MKTSLLLLLASCVLLSYAGEVPADYVGSKKCKICHNKVKVGQQYDIWEKGPHAKSFETLKSEQAINIAKGLGIAEPPEKAAACLSCHVSGWSTASGYKLEVDPLDKKALKVNTDLARVGCESCHGPGSLYKSKKTMIGIANGELKGGDHGLINIVSETCTACHNSDSPTYKPFVFEERVKEIVHPTPTK
ncbi:hypothetical protein HQ531_01805 [bacterium]|nr:hypothetical protein [bacterium]